MTDDAAASELDEALSALADVSVALLTLYPIMRVLHGPPEPLGYIEDGIEACSRARRHLLALRCRLSEARGGI